MPRHCVVSNNTAPPNDRAITGSATKTIIATDMTLAIRRSADDRSRSHTGGGGAEPLQQARNQSPLERGSGNRDRLLEWQRATPSEGGRTRSDITICHLEVRLFVVHFVNLTAKQPIDRRGVDERERHDEEARAPEHEGQAGGR